MSKIEELIKKLCPDGVRYKNLKELCLIKTGKLNANSKDKEGVYPFFTCDANPFKINSYAFDCEAIIISGNGSQVGHINYYVGKFNAYQRTYVLSEFSSLILVKFVLHYLMANLKQEILKLSKKGSVPYITLPMLENFEVPVPPMEIQREIVQVLDNFAELSAELSAELQLRRKQYEFYRDHLLTFNQTDVKLIKLEDIAEIYDGIHSTPEYRDEGIKFVSVENINDLYNTNKYISKEAYLSFKIKPQVNDIFMTRIGSIGVCNIVDKNEDLAYYVSLALIRPNNKIVSSKFLKYIIESGIGKNELNKRTLFHAVPIKINKNEIGKIVLPIPPLEIQNKIVDILDNFDKICSDLGIGLPAEIEARQKQYEYYRDKLLTFDISAGGGV